MNVGASFFDTSHLWRSASLKKREWKERLKTSQAEYQIDFVRLASLLMHWKTMNSPLGETEPRRIRRGSLLYTRISLISLGFHI